MKTTQGVYKAYSIVNAKTLQRNSEFFKRFQREIKERCKDQVKYSYKHQEKLFKRELEARKAKIIQKRSGSASPNRDMSPEKS